MDRVLARKGGLVSLLRIPSSLFAGVSSARRFLYDRRLFPVLRVPVPVISVGNIAVGGTGKTPMVMHLVQYLTERGVRVGVLARGYGKKAQGTFLNEEGLMLQARFPKLLQVQDKDRIRGAMRLVDQGVQCILLDDGFQHRRLFRNLDIVLLDASRMFGLPSLHPGEKPVEAHLPRGFLREGLSALRRANLVIITRSDMATPETLEYLLQRINKAAPGVPHELAHHAVSGFWQVPSERFGLDHFEGQTVDLVSAIGNPEAFEESATRAGIQVREHRSFPDHHPYQQRDLAGLGEVPVVTTAKDLPKLLGVLGDSHWKPWVLDVEMSWGSTGGHGLDSSLKEILETLSARDDDSGHAALHAGLHG